MKLDHICTLGLLMLAACAQSPDRISASYVSDVGYSSWSYKDLGEEYGRLVHALAGVEVQQKNAHMTDIVGVTLIGVPFSTLSGKNRAEEVRRLKGERNAVASAFRKNGCK